LKLDSPPSEHGTETDNKPITAEKKARRVKADHVKSGLVTFITGTSTREIKINVDENKIWLPNINDSWDPVTSVPWRDLSQCAKFTIAYYRGGSKADLERIKKSSN